MNKISLALFLSIVSFGQVLAEAQPASGQSHDMVKMWQASLARQPLAVAATFDAKGRLWLASVKDGHVMVSHSDDRGETYSAPVKVNSEAELVAADGENRPKILVAGNGNVYVSYTRSLETPFAGNVRFSRSTDGGKSFSAPITVNDNHELFTHRFDTMGVNGRGQIYIAWLDKRDAAATNKKGEKYSGIAVYYAVSDDEGRSFKPNIKATDHSCECCRIAMALDTDDYPVITWRHIYDTNIRDHALVKLDGKMAPLRLSHENWNIAACPHHGPSLSIASDGIYHATWFNNAGLFYAHSADQGKTFSKPLNFGGFEAQAAHPYVLSLGSRVYLAWKEFDGNNTGIFVMESGDGGKSWSEQKRLAATSDASDNPLLISENNRAYLSWNTLKEGYRLIEMTAQNK
ncbi:MAG: glycoside hydrolase [Gallionellaceae bacterium]|nr:glycoside hydrolase [Gallionellaceae bacterium]